MRFCFVLFCFCFFLFFFLFFIFFLFLFFIFLHETIDRQSPAESDEVVQCSSGKFGGRQLTNIIIMMASEGLLDSSDLLNYTGVFLR